MFFRNVSHEWSNCEMFCSDERPGIYSHFVCDKAWSASPWRWKGNLQPSDCITVGNTPWFCENGWGWEGGRDEDLGVGAENAWSGKGGTQVILLCWCCWCRWWAWWSGCWWWSSLWCTWWPQMVLIIILCGQNTIKCLIQFLSVQLSWYVWPHCYSSWWCEEVNQMKLNINLSRLHFWILFRSSPSVGDVSFELAPKRFRYIWNLYLHIDIFLAVFGDTFCTIWCHQVQQDIAASPGYEVNIKFESFFSSSTLYRIYSVLKVFIIFCLIPVLFSVMTILFPSWSQPSPTRRFSIQSWAQDFSPSWWRPLQALRLCPRNRDRKVLPVSLGRSSKQCSLAWEENVWTSGGQSPLDWKVSRLIPLELLLVVGQVFLSRISFHGPRWISRTSTPAPTWTTTSSLLNPGSLFR